MDAQDVNGNDWLEFQPEWCGGATDKGPRRAENQDAFWIPDRSTPTDLGALYLVADGVGGQQDGAVASKLAVETVQQVFYDLRRQGEPIPGALKEALEKANQVIIEEGQKRQVRKMGSTFVAAAMEKGQLMVAHVGDARAYLIRNDELLQLTRDDTWVQRQVDAGLITDEEAAKHEFRNVVTQVLGNKPEINVNLSKSHVLQPGDVIMLCSDGLYDVLSDGQMVSLVSENEPLQAATLLVQAAVEAEATDNITAVVVGSGEASQFADEPTLVSVPVEVAVAATAASTAAEEATLTTLPPVEDAKTVPIQAPPPTSPAPKEEDKGGISKWLIVLAIAAILLIAGAIAAFWLRNSNLDREVDNAVETAQPEIAETLPAALDTVMPTLTIEALVPTEEFTETPTRLSNTPTPMATFTPSPTPDSVVAATKFTIGANAIVANTDNVGVSVRSGPSTLTERLLIAEEGTNLVILGGPEEEDVFTWWQVRLANGTVGWVAERFLEPTAADNE